MSTRESTAIDHALSLPSLSAAFVEKARSNPDATALSMYGTDERLTWREWHDRGVAVAGGLAALGLERGDRVGILLGTRPEFNIVDVGALLLGAIPFSIYTTSAVGQMREIIDNAAPRVLITDASLVGKAREIVAAGDTTIERVIVVEDDAVQGDELSLAGLERLATGDFDVEASVAATTREDIGTLVYTSGTTGAPKGVQFRHGGMMDCLDSIRQRFSTDENDRAIAYLPMAHIAERIFGHYAAFVYGYEVTSLADLTKLGPALHSVQPTRFFGVPRIYEKLLAAVHRFASESDDREVLKAAWDRRLARVREGHGWIAVDDDDAKDLETLKPLAALTGLSNAHFLAVAGAPSSLSMLEELTALGIAINEFYGSSEAIIVSCSPPEDIRLGTAGKALAGATFALAEDGEVLIKGPTITPGYFRDPERTAEAFDDDGWFLTGDIAEIDDDGYIRIVDRKKALIINSAGKNMSPANIEQAIKGGQPLISQIFAIGDRRPYNVGLVVLDRDGLAVFAKANGLDPEEDFTTLSQRPEVVEAVEAAVEAGNQKLSRVEQLKKVRVLDHDWLPGGPQLTPTNKVKRREVAEQYADITDELYA
ncbi:AMP-dependent synthetase/ligase [Patulibacter minatonensis]|uniref:AMP-dependent synthetase/ligase n=1 Tax=Patulibacter minatonensis TaxID=298163 RepID=UPI00047D82E3|nr:AMP-binding protein [Patulibacter minatonensis]